MVSLVVGKKQYAKCRAEFVSNIKYPAFAEAMMDRQVSDILFVSLGIKCVQRVNSLGKKMCTTVSSAHEGFTKIVDVCTKNVRSTVVQQFIHSQKLATSIWFESPLYTLSTEPTITTILIHNKDQKRPAKEII